MFGIDSLGKQKEKQFPQVKYRSECKAIGVSPRGGKGGERETTSSQMPNQASYSEVYVPKGYCVVFTVAARRVPFRVTTAHFHFPKSS